MLYRTHLAMSWMEFELTTLEAIGTPGISYDTLSFRTKTWYFEVLWLSRAIITDLIEFVSCYDIQQKKKFNKI
jgi:hypothetical protein